MLITSWRPPAQCGYDPHYQGALLQGSLHPHRRRDTQDKPFSVDAIKHSDGDSIELDYLLLLQLAVPLPN